MLSNEARPVELIATDERGCPRWVMCHWEATIFDECEPEPERVLLVDIPTTSGEAIIYLPSELENRTVPTRILEEIPVE